MRTHDSLRAAFSDRFGTAPRVSRAPGRVNLIGEHTDYNEGFVFPAAIRLDTRVAFAPASESVFRIASAAYPDDEVVVSETDRPSARGHWSDYVLGVRWSLEDRGIQIPAAHVLIESDVPLGAGLSSSASLEVAVALAYLALAGRELDPTDVALVCQRAENEFVGTQCGIMDMLIACLGRAGHALLVDCRSRAVRPVAIPEDLELLVLDSGVKHSLAAGEYNRRRAECEDAVRALRANDPGISSLRDVRPEALEAGRSALDEAAHRRARHVVRENARVLDFADALASGELDRMGRLLRESHESLRTDFEVSCSELDTLVALASRESAVIGARMTGGGFGGCTVNLVRAGQGDAVARRVLDGYLQATGQSGRAWVTRPEAGASVS